jgi:exodeoxyribonuclease V alpha subunit
LYQASGPRDRLAREHVGVIASFLFSDPDSGTLIARLTDGTVVKGRAAELADAGNSGRDKLRFFGRWLDHPRHGPQFHFDTFTRFEPASRKGVIRYLTELCPGIGQQRAADLYDAFGGDAVATLRERPGEAAQAAGIPEDVAQLAAEKLEENRQNESTKIALFALFAGRGFPSDDLIPACIARWSHHAPERIRRNPFALLVAGLPGCGFKRCDRLWLDLGRPLASLKRQMLCAWDAIRADGTGHTWRPMGDALRAVRDNVAGVARPERAVRLGLRAGWFLHRRDEQGKLWLAESEKGRAERRLADAVARLMRREGRPLLWPRLTEESGLSEHQLGRLAVTTSAPFGLLTGSPGTGKTTCAGKLVAAIIDQYGRDSIAACAPTGKAAVRLTQAFRASGAGGLIATTIHRLLGLGKASFVQRVGPAAAKRHAGDWNERIPLPYRFIVAEELSMLDTSLGAELFAACGRGTHVLCLGDVGQLPPVGHGSPLRDLIAAGVPNGELTEIRRNAGMIVHACAAIKDGRRFEVAERYDHDAGHNLRLIERPDAEATHAALLGLLGKLQASGPFHPVWQTQVVVAVNEKGELSRKRLNAEMQQMLNPDGRSIPGNPFRVGDKIVCLKNGRLARQLLREPLADGKFPPDDPAGWVTARDGGGEPEQCYVANGEVGRVLAVGDGVTVGRFSEADDVVRIPMRRGKGGGDADEGDGREEEKGRGCDFDLGYAMTAHRLQGSEAPCIIVVIDQAAGRVASKPWWYTALSRASKLCVVIGRRLTMEKQCKREVLNTRKTFLRELLLANLSPPEPTPCPTEA